MQRLAHPAEAAVAERLRVYLSNGLTEALNFSLRIVPGWHRCCLRSPYVVRLVVRNSADISLFAWNVARRIAQAIFPCFRIRVFELDFALG